MNLDNDILEMVKISVKESLRSHTEQEVFYRTKARHARTAANIQKHSELAQKYALLAESNRLSFDLINTRLSMRYTQTAAQPTAQKPKIAENTKPLQIPETINEVEIPDQYICPITTQIMTDPVILTDGHVYEKQAIQEWLKTHNTSPMTKAIVCKDTLIPCFPLKTLIDEFVTINCPKK